jgi:hypothetical protein
MAKKSLFKEWLRNPPAKPPRIIFRAESKRAKICRENWLRSGMARIGLRKPFKF